MAVKNVVKAIPRMAFNSANLVAGFLPINSIPIPEALFMVRIINAATTPVNISYDGVGLHDYIPANGVLQLEFQTNSQPNSQCALLPRGSSVYVSGTAGVGSIYLIGYFQPQV